MLYSRQFYQPTFTRHRRSRFLPACCRLPGVGKAGFLPTSAGEDGRRHVAPLAVSLAGMYMSPANSVLASVLPAPTDFCRYRQGKMGVTILCCQPFHQPTCTRHRPNRFLPACCRFPKVCKMLRHLLTYNFQCVSIQWSNANLVRTHTADGYCAHRPVSTTPIKGFEGWIKSVTHQDVAIDDAGRRRRRDPGHATPHSGAHCYKGLSRPCTNTVLLTTRCKRRARPAPAPAPLRRVAAR